ncbi:Ribonuclease H2 subunit A [Picochlorum sp. SENEW3]|nr:Ribonuclease H2 subunit A [Picochlorum sp. SENEW3]WPT17250.1 Ribonuclease H2 subunit A [Picochlorum sp. SENEW3]
MVVYRVEEKEVKALAWHNDPCLVGIDEAGRGPVIGPMVYSAAVSTISNGGELKKREFADSKVLTAEKRDELFDEIQSDNLLCCFVDEISASKISGLMLAPEKVNLNTIAFDSTVGLIQKCLDEGMNVEEVYVDTVGDASSYQAKLSGRFSGIKFTVKPKADALYPIVSAASIAAKVTRDRVIEGLGGDRGSGYPSDPKTKEWLSRSMDPIFGYDQAVRFSWGTVDKILQKGVVVDWECNDEGDGKLTFTHENKRKRETRHSYFNSRRLQKARICM